MAAAAILDFWIHKMLLVARVQRTDTHHRSKFRQNWSILWRYCMDFQICEILLADGVWRAHTNHCQNWSFRSWHVAIFRIFKMAATAIFIFEIAKFYWLMGSRGSRYASVPFRQNRSINCEDIKIFLFLRWRPSAILDLFRAYLDHLDWVNIWGSLSLCIIWLWSIQ